MLHFYYLGYFCAYIWFMLWLDIILCHYYCSVMQLLPAPCFSRFQLGSLRSVTVTHRKRGMENAPHLFTYKCCCLQPARIDKTFSIFFSCNDFLKYHDIFLKLYCSLLIETYKHTQLAIPHVCSW